MKKKIEREDQKAWNKKPKVSKIAHIICNSRKKKPLNNRKSDTPLPPPKKDVHIICNSRKKTPPQKKANNIKRGRNGKKFLKSGWFRNEKRWTYIEKKEN